MSYRGFDLREYNESKHQTTKVLDRGMLVIQHETLRPPVRPET